VKHEKSELPSSQQPHYYVLSTLHTLMDLWYYVLG